MNAAAANVPNAAASAMPSWRLWQSKEGDEKQIMDIFKIITRCFPQLFVCGAGPMAG